MNVDGTQREGVVVVVVMEVVGEVVDLLMYDGSHSIRRHMLRPGTQRTSKSGRWKTSVLCASNGGLD
jgi:hypothetical protein